MNTQKNLFMLSLAAVSTVTAILAAGCDLSGHYHPETQNRSAPKYYGVALDGFGKINVYAANAHAITVTADMDIVDRITTDVDSVGVLRVGAKRDTGIDDGGMSAFRKWPIGVDVRLSRLQYVAIGKNGVGDVTVAAADTVREILVFHEGEGDIDLRRYKVSAVTVVHSGRGRVRVGEIDTLYIDSTAFHSAFGTIQYAGKQPEIMWFRKWELSGGQNYEGCNDNPDRLCGAPGSSGDMNPALLGVNGRPSAPLDGIHPPPNTAGDGWVLDVASNMRQKVVPEESVPIDYND